MAKSSGLGSVVKAEDSSAAVQTISNGITNYSFTTPRATQDVTGVDKFAHEMLLLLADYSVTLNGVFNSSGAQGSDTATTHAVFSTIPSTTVQRSVEFDPVGTATGDPKLAVTCVLTDYQVTRAATGELTFQVPGQLADGTAPAWSTN